MGDKGKAPINERKLSMDPRCPRQLSCHPDSWCPLAVLRLKAIRDAGRELTDEEEAILPGCTWAVNHQMANYCFFKFAADFLDEKPLSDIEIAYYNNLSIESVKGTEKVALQKMAGAQSFEDLMDGKNGPIVQDRDSEEARIVK